MHPLNTQKLALQNFVNSMCWIQTLCELDFIEEIEEIGKNIDYDEEMNEQIFKGLNLLIDGITNKADRLEKIRNQN